MAPSEALPGAVQELYRPPEAGLEAPNLVDEVRSEAGSWIRVRRSRYRPGLREAGDAFSMIPLGLTHFFVWLLLAIAIGFATLSAVVPLILMSSLAFFEPFYTHAKALRMAKRLKLAAHDGSTVRLRSTPRLSLRLGLPRLSGHDDVGVMMLRPHELRYRGDRVTFRLRREDIAGVRRRAIGTELAGRLGHPHLELTSTVGGVRRIALVATDSVFTVRGAVQASRALERELQDWLEGDEDDDLDG